MKKFFKAVGISVLYLLFFFALQMAVIVGVLTFLCFMEMLPY